MKQGKRNCAMATLLAAVLCVAAGCAAPPVSHDPAGEGSEAREGSTVAGLPENSGEEGASTAGSREPGTIDELVSADELMPPSEEEIAALGIREDMLAYWMVLNNKKAFNSWDEGGQKFFWNEYFWYYTDSVCKEHYADGFMVMDMDGDGREEIVLDCFPGTTHILHYEDGEVYGYWFGTRGMSIINKDGVYISSDGAARNWYYRLMGLNKDGYVMEEVAVEEEDYYEVGGKEVTEEEFWAYVESLEGVGDAEEVEFSESTLDQRLLGNLSEEELALVKRLPAEDVPEKEPDYRENKRALQTYAAVLKGEQDVVFATGGAREDDGTFMKYFSLVDMDGDGSLELVLTCNDNLVWILRHEGGRVRGYPLRTSCHRWRGPFIATDGVFQTEDGNLSSTGYARIVEFGEDGYRTEPVEGRGDSGHDWIRYYFYSEETIAQWLE